MDKPRRKCLRLAEYDYAREGAYFVTVCAQGRQSVFGKIMDGRMQMSRIGKIVDECWRVIPDHFAHIRLDEYMVMPDHIHGIIFVDHARRGTACRAPTTERFGKPVAGSIPTIVRSFKSAVTKRIHEIPGIEYIAVWQRNYYEHIIRNDADLNRVRQYIEFNPQQWPFDRENHAA